MHRNQYLIDRYADAQTCTEAPQDQRRGRRKGHREDATKRCLTFLHDHVNAPSGTPATAGGRLSSAIPGGTPADSPTIRSPGARSLGRPTADRDTDNKRVGSLFVYRRCDSKNFQTPCCPHGSAGTPALDVADAPPLQPDCVANCLRKASIKIPKNPLNHSPRKRRY